MNVKSAFLNGFTEDVEQPPSFENNKFFELCFQIKETFYGLK